MNPMVNIGHKAIAPIVLNDQPVLTLRQVDELHERPADTSRRNFNKNISRFVEGEDYLKIRADEIRTRNAGALSANARGKITVVTETGYLMLTKSFTDDLSWKVQRALVRVYFRAKEVQPEAQPLTVAPKMEIDAADYYKMRAEPAELKLEREVARKRTRRPMAPDERRRILSQYAQGVPAAEIAAALGRSVDSVRTVIYRHQQHAKH